MGKVVDETIDPTDPRFRIFYPAKQHYMPGYWRTPEEAAIVEALSCEHCGNGDAPHVTVAGQMCSDCLSMCVD